ncbi:phycobilisome rod-core linker polypeptide [Cyanobium sp. ATX 6F1]|uniref:phycobilisome rod-core linker polypeptide n=1 Tax=unclassified Cyanobium TaxID=2627006 RepID=UPI0020CF31E3|nr:phycobilisome rod-core linker polypeptide [Cyanobium sp. ATX 6F1]MCP9916846.1 phycobilisome rod-core linker polypeptide [Cyanobium sp. ATX 6F1]
MGSSRGFVASEPPVSAMAKALRPGKPQGLTRRRSLPERLRLSRFPGEGELQSVLRNVYRQLLNRDVLASERLGDAESQLRDGHISVSEFVALLASSELFGQRLNRLAPLRAATAAYLALLGRAAQASEVSAFLASQANHGQQRALETLINSDEYATNFGRDTVPYLRGLDTPDGLPLTTLNRTASLYGGNAALNPPTKGAI